VEDTATPVDAALRRTSGTIRFIGTAARARRSGLHHPIRDLRAQVWGMGWHLRADLVKQALFPVCERGWWAGCLASDHWRVGTVCIHDGFVPGSDVGR
jgi:hypothetical protein